MTIRTACCYALLVCALPFAAQAAEKAKPASRKCEIPPELAANGERMEWKGACVDGRPQGPGNLVWFEKSRKLREFEGELIDGYPEGKGRLGWENGKSYIGEFTRGAITGAGELRYPNGDRYDGPLLEDQPHGIGVMLRRDGSRLLARFLKGQSQGDVSLRLQNGERFQGTLANGKPEGKGTLHLADGELRANFTSGVAAGKGTFIFPDGRRFDGVIVANRPGGAGSLELINGDRCEGEVRGDGTLSGRVHCTYLNGNVFDGTLQQGFNTGRGILTYPDGSTFDGNISAGQPQGNGIFIYAGRHGYKGELVAGIRQGKGSYTWADGLKFEGEFKAGLPEGSGSYQWPDGSRYSGEISEGLPAGEGRMQWADGRLYQGKFIDGLADGPGVLTLPDKTVYQGLFTDDLKDGKGVLITPGGERTELVFDNDIPREEKGSYLSMFKSKAEEIGGLVGHFHGGWAQHYYLKHKEHFDANAAEYKAVLDRLAVILAEPAERKLGVIAALTTMRMLDLRQAEDFAALKALKESADKPAQTLASIPLLKQRGFRSRHAAVLDQVAVGERAGAALAAYLAAGDWQNGMQFVDAAQANEWTPAKDQPTAALARALIRRPALATEQATELGRLAAIGIAPDKTVLRDGYAARIHEALVEEDFSKTFEILRGADALGIPLDRQALADALRRRLAGRVLAAQDLELALRAQVFVKQAGLSADHAELQQVLLAVFRERLVDQQAPRVLTYLRDAAAHQIPVGDARQADEVFGILQARLDAGRWADALALFDAFRKAGIDTSAQWAKGVAVLRSGQIGGNSPFPLSLANDTGIQPVSLDSLGDETESLDFLNPVKHIVLIDVHPRYAQVRLSQRASQKSSFAEGFQDVANPDYQQIEIEIQNAQMEYSRATGAEAKSASGSPSLFGNTSSGNKNTDKLAKTLELFSTITQATGGGSKPSSAPATIMSQIQSLQERLLKTPRMRREPVVTEYDYEELDIDVSRHVPVTIYLLDRSRETFSFSRLDLTQSDAMRTALGIHNKDKTAKRHERLDRIKQLERKATSLSVGDLASRGITAPTENRPLESLTQQVMSNRERQEVEAAQVVEQSHQAFDKALQEVLAGFNDEARSRDEQLLQIMRHTADTPQRESRDSRKLGMLIKNLTRQRSNAPPDPTRSGERPQPAPQRRESVAVNSPAAPTISRAILASPPAGPASMPMPPGVDVARSAPTRPAAPMITPLSTAPTPTGQSPLTVMPVAPTPVPATAVAPSTLATTSVSIPSSATVMSTDTTADVTETVFSSGDITYEGRFKVNPGGRTVSGTGTMRWANGNVFVGTLVDSVETGRGKLVWANGQTYDGDWKDGKMHGRGEIRFPDGQVYKGDWQDGKMEGRGEILFPNGNKYVGSVVDGRPEGQGRMASANGDVYDGAFRQGVIAGTGSFRWANGTSYTGEWADGKPDGRGEYTWASGERAAGLYKNGVKVD
jgi:hypothetical protein